MRTMLIILLLHFTIPSAAQPQKEIKAQIDSLISYIKLKGTEAFAQHTVYQGEDPARKWKDVYDPSSPEELKAAKAIMEEFKKAFAGCNFKEFDTFKVDKQNEGAWFVYTYACGADKKLHLAFLKIGNRYALGDIDVESDDED